MPRHGTDHISLLPGRSLIKGRLLRWRAPFYIDKGRRIKHKGLELQYYRVMDWDRNTITRMIRFKNAYVALQFIYDETRLRGWHNYLTPTEDQMRCYMHEVERQKDRDREASKAALALRQREIYGPRQAAKRRARTAGKLVNENLFRAPGSKPRRGYGEAKDLPYLQRRDPLFGED